MIMFLKSATSRRVSNEEIEQQDCKYKHYLFKEVDANDKEGGSCTTLTVWRKSLLVSCCGFTVFDCKGNLVFRVDNYCPRPCDVVLMDAYGKSILTMRRHKTLRLVDDWIVYDGEATDDQQNKIRCQKKSPICYVKKHVSLLQANRNVIAEVFMSTSPKKPTYVIEGSYCQRSCKVFDKSSDKVVAEIKRKEATNGCASFGVDVFQLVVSPGFDAGFAMALVLLLDQMFS